MGDPGIFSFLGGAVKSLVGGIPIVGGMLSNLLPGTNNPTPSPAGLGGIGLMAPGGGTVGAAIARHPILTGLAGLAGGGLVTAATGLLKLGATPVSGAPMVGAHMGRVPRPSGKGYYTRRHLAALQRGLTRARPRMNPFNPSALRRAERRAHAFLRRSARLIRYYRPKKPKGKAYIHTKKKAA
jgi:hypothetical protein